MSHAATRTPAAGRLLTRRVPLIDLARDPSNARIHGQANLEAIAASLRRFGQAEPLVVQKGSLRIIAGHGRLDAMRALGWKDADVVELDVSNLDATALAIALNRTAELAEWDDAVLAKLLGELQEAGAAAGTGYSTDEIDELLEELRAGAGDVDDPGPGEVPEKPVSRPGDLWLLDGQRLLCGDSTKAEDVARVLAGERPVLVATDPPYGVAYSGADRPGKGGKNWAAAGRGADVAHADLDRLLDGFLAAALARAAKGVAVYVWHATVRQPAIAAAFERRGLLLHQIVVWAKPVPALTFAFYAWQHEPCAVGWRKGGAAARAADHVLYADEHEPCVFGWRRGEKPDRTVKGIVGSVWSADWEGRARPAGAEHPTQKPVRLFEIPMLMHTRRGAAVLEPFSGSGSQLVAAEKLGRRCHAIEISPAFVDVAVRRWEGATGKKAVLEEGRKKRRTFDAIAAERETTRPDRETIEPRRETRRSKRETPPSRRET